MVFIDEEVCKKYRKIVFGRQKNWNWVCHECFGICFVQGRCYKNYDNVCLCLLKKNVVNDAYNVFVT